MFVTFLNTREIILYKKQQKATTKLSIALVLALTGAALQLERNLLEPTGAALEPNGALLEPGGVLLEPLSAVLEPKNFFFS